MAQIGTTSMEIAANKAHVREMLESDAFMAENEVMFLGKDPYIPRLVSANFKVSAAARPVLMSPAEQVEPKRPLPDALREKKNPRDELFGTMELQMGFSTSLGGLTGLKGLRNSAQQ
mmetsp:Transcript_4344/g.10132  ORF Transcript_4344/g.10132 Transcript_4344/m.10132 type:complete len:117 (+) Transcript_4344:87-437(+)|eukprot:CAMPEP_0171063356 /NCGR_PEP_ID=MMETSP0766_2-20121228/5606_1 /TAXON_ID=439317 /ORGANISM="Gambierdiscus australes, Strain CAWD 149" /LENGTH=116 /DNA_ID=CAMNT_0011519249 /DNA_START=73 /DNA_END=423 /DNA_ORIENTATION=-